MSSGEILRIIGVYKTLDCHERPSVLMGIENDYLAFCFDEACAFIIKQLEDGRKPIIKKNDGEVVKEYKRPSDLYNKYSTK